MLSQVGQSSQALVKRREMEAELHPFSVLKTFLLGDFFPEKEPGSTHSMQESWEARRL